MMKKYLVINITAFLPSHTMQVAIMSSVFLSTSGSIINDSGIIDLSFVIVASG